MIVRPWLVPFVLLFWCATTSWLFIEKILPSFASGTAPGYQAMYSSQGRPVAWTVLWNEQPLGWALSQTRREEDGGMDVETALHFDRLPIDDVLPKWTNMLFRRSFAADGVMTLDARGHLSIDASGALRSFRSRIDLPTIAEHVVLSGAIDKGTVTVLVNSRDLHYSTKRHLPTNVALGDELSPQATLPGLSLNRRWTVPVYSPLRPGKSPVEILHARVVSEEALFWADSLVRVHVVHYRDDPAGHHGPRCRLWVDRNGKVLKQESEVLGSRLVFVRRTDEATDRLMATIEAEPVDIGPVGEAEDKETPSSQSDMGSS